MKVAIIHDWMGPMTGAERALEQLLLAYPGADVFTTVDFLAAEHRHRLHGARVTTSFLQRLPRVRQNIWNYVPLMPMAVEQFDLRAYDLVISNSHAVAKGVIVHPHQVHVCYLMTPMRFAWDLQASYLSAHGYDRGLRSLVARFVFARLRRWDAMSASRVDTFISISRFVARRAEQCYGRPSVIIHPPVDVDFFVPGERHDDFYVAASRLTPFKNIGSIVAAFRQLPDRRLVVVGDGPEAERIRGIAPPNVQLVGHQPDVVLRDYLQRARALVFAAPEDFGLIMAEAQACGTPVIAHWRGGASDIVIDDDRGRTGLLFRGEDPASIVAAICRFERLPAVSGTTCRKNAERFSAHLFRARIRREVDAVVAAFSAQRGIGGVDAFRHRLRHAVEAERSMAPDREEVGLPVQEFANLD
jgi:glycosyltransferase involved in cell wall biosynthesis